MLVAALVLCVAGLAKLRSPAAAARAVGAQPRGDPSVRGRRAGARRHGRWPAAAPSAGGADGGAVRRLRGAHAAAGPGGASLRLLRRRAARRRRRSSRCSARALAAVCAVGARRRRARRGLDPASGPPGRGACWCWAPPAAVYGTVLAYSELPLLWRSWSPAMSPAARLAGALGSLLERRTSRRGVLARAALAGSAFAVAPVRYLVRPGHRRGGDRARRLRRPAPSATTATPRSAARSSTG